MNYRCSLVLAIVLGILNFLPEVAFATWPVRHADSRNSGWLPLAGPQELKPKWHSLDKLPVATFVGIGRKGDLYTCRRGLLAIKLALEASIPSSGRTFLPWCDKARSARRLLQTSTSHRRGCLAGCSRVAVVRVCLWG